MRSSRAPASSSSSLAVSFTALAIAATVGTPSVAHACGAAYPGGPVMCDFPRREGEGASAATSTRPVARVSTSYAFTSTTLLFTKEHRADLTRHAVFGGVEIPLSRSATSPVAIQFGAGGIAGGELVHASGTDSVGPGFSAFGGIGKRIVDGRGYAPFVQLTGIVSATHMLTRSRASTRTSERFTAVDFRFGAIVGKTIGGVFTPYVTGRVFGGPVFWKVDGDNVLGTDLYKYQVGGGLSLALFDRKVDVFAEGIGLGERGVAAGIGTTFF